MVRINKKRPFSQPNSVRVNEIELELDRACHKHQALLQLRQAIIDGKLTEDLYDFLNMDGSLEEMLIGLPPIVDGIGCEALREEQLKLVDKAIEGVGQDIKNFFRRLWEALKEWLLDWWDLNRNTRIKLRARLATFKQNSSAFGDPTDFESIQAVVYHRPHWEVMRTACEMMNSIFLQLPQKDIGKFIESRRPQIARCCEEFGQSIGPGIKLEKPGNPKYDTIYTTLGAARWRFNLIETDMEKAIKCLTDEIAYRREFSKLEALFKNATVEEKNYITFTRQLVMRFKSNTLVVARGLDRVLRAAIAAAKK